MDKTTTIYPNMEDSEEYKELVSKMFYEVYKNTETDPTPSNDLFFGMAKLSAKWKTKEQALAGLLGVESSWGSVDSNFVGTRAMEVLNGKKSTKQFVAEQERYKEEKFKQDYGMTSEEFRKLPLKKRNELFEEQIKKENKERKSPF